MTQPDIATRLTPALYAGCFRKSPPLSPDGTPSANYDRSLAAPALLALREHMADLAASGVLSHMAGAGGRGGQLIDAWKAMVDGKGDELDAEVCSRFAFGRMMILGMVGVERAVESGTSFENACGEAYAAFVAAAAKGEVHGIEGTSEVCSTTGEHMGFTMAGWRPVAMTFGMETGFAPAHDVEAPGLQHVEVEFPSGQVIVADCIRIPAFLEAIGWDRRDVGSQAGRIAGTRDMAALGVASVWIGRGGSPMVATVDGTLTLGNLDGEYDGPEPANLGRVSTDMWRLSVIG